MIIDAEFKEIDHTLNADFDVQLNVGNGGKGEVDYSLVANALKGNASGSAIALTDVSPFEHVLNVRVRTKKEPSYTVSSSDEQYVTITDAELFVQKTKDAGVKYESGEEIVFALGLVTDDAPYPLYCNGNKIMDVDYNCGLDFPDLTNATFNITVHYEDGSVYVQRYGGNLLDIEGREVVNFGEILNTSKRTFTGKGIIKGYAYSNYYNTSYITSFEKIKNGFTYSTKNDSYGIGFDIKVSPNTMYSVYFDGLIGSNCFLGEYDKDGNYLGHIFTSATGGVNGARTFTTRENGAWVVINPQLASGGEVVAVNNFFVGVGAFAGFEEYKEPTTYPINADGTVEGITPIYPSTTLVADTEGVVMDVEYNRDINKAFAEIVNAIISIGGNV